MYVQCQGQGDANQAEGSDVLGRVAGWITALPPLLNVGITFAIMVWVVVLKATMDLIVRQKNRAAVLVKLVYLTVYCHV